MTFSRAISPAAFSARHKSSPNRQRSGQPLGADFRVNAFDPPKDLSQERLKQRLGLLNSLESAGVPFARYQERAVDLLAGPESAEGLRP